MKIKQVALAEIYELFKARPEHHVWIDVRQPGEWASGTIPGAERITLAELPGRLSGLDKAKTYVLVCLSGGRSSQASLLMASAGFQQLINFEGGMLAWKAAGYPLT